MENKELETWLKETKAKNLNEKELFDYINEFMPFSMYHKLRSELNVRQVEDVAKILFNQWQKEAEFSPKRGDRVLADYKEKMIEIIDEKINKLETLKSLLIAEL